MKKIILCADDYALNTAVSQGIVQLLAQGRLTAVSCLTTSNHWLKHAVALQPFRKQADIGLHFNLTEGRPLAATHSSLARNGKFLPLALLMAKAYSRCIDIAEVEQELLAQLDAFSAGMQQLPNFIDGHQHIHQLPVIREAVVKVYTQRLNSQSYIRLALQKQGGGLKAKIIALAGAKVLQKLLQQHAIPFNRSFSGVYSFTKAHNYRQFFGEFLATITDQGLIMCHPGLENTTTEDVLYKSRLQEWDYFMSEQFSEDCNYYKIQLARFKLVK